VGDDGYRVLPAAAYMDHTEKMARVCEMRFWASSRCFGVEIRAIRGPRRKTNWHNMFQTERLPRESERIVKKLTMPAPNELRGKFSFETKVMPLPDAADFRVSLGDEEKMRIQRQITATVEASLQVASRDLWQRLF